jgi:hypothetical protein
MAQSFFGQNDPVVASTVPAEAVPEVVASDVEDAAPAIPTIAAAEDRRIRRKFDVASALKSGRSFTEIADELAALNNFDAEEARKSTIDPATGKKIPGYSDEEIISKLVDIRNISNVQAFGEGAKRGLLKRVVCLLAESWPLMLPFQFLRALVRYSPPPLLLPFLQQSERLLLWAH